MRGFVTKTILVRSELLARQFVTKKVLVRSEFLAGESVTSVFSLEPS